MALDAAGWDFSCPDWRERLAEGRSLVPTLPLDEEEGERAVAIFNNLCVPDVAGQPAMAEAAGDWFRDIVRACFGSLDRETGERMVSELFALVPKKNAKTTYTAALGLVALLLNERPNADMLVIGPTQDVADLCFAQAAGMIAADPEGYLKDRFHVAEHKKEIRDLTNGAKLKIKSFDTRVMTGQKPVLVIVDELHVMSAFSSASRVLGQVRGGLLPFAESLLIFITTQSDQAPAGVFKAELQAARAVRDGTAPKGTRKLAVLYEFPPELQARKDAPWRDPALWRQVTPNLGKSISLPALVRDYEEARAKGEAEERRWASQHLNLEIGIALKAEGWVGAPLWIPAKGAPADLEEMLEACDVAVAGIDGGGLDDLLGLGVIGRRRADRAWLCWGRAWAQPEVFERRPEIAETLRDFEKAGDLIVCETATQDLEEVADVLERVAELGLLPEAHAIGLDPFGVAALVDEIVSRGISDEQLASIRQGPALSPAIWGIERKLKDGTFLHSGSPLLAWCVGNARAEQRGNAVYITKETAGKAKIDPLVAIFNAAMLMSRNPQARPKGGSLLDLDAVVL